MSYLDVKEFEKWMRSSSKTLESAKKDLEFEFYNWRASRLVKLLKRLKGCATGGGSPGLDTH
jgi:hypothetical protein